MSNRICGILIVIFFATILTAIDFSWEFLRFDVSANRVDTYGEFYMDNCDGNGAPVTLLFPFATDKNLGHPLDITIFGLDNSEIEWHWARQDTMLILKCPQNPCGFAMQYRTPIVEDKFVYILKSIHTWGEPLDSCRVEVRYPISLPVKSNYPADTVFIQDSIAIANFLFIDFIPPQNFVIKIDTIGF